MFRTLFNRNVINKPDRGTPVAKRRWIEGGDSTLLSPSGLSGTFSPTRPQFGNRSFVGRQKELVRILRALRQEHAHVVLFAERGRGKSSVANYVVEQLQSKNGIVARATCDPYTDFDTLVRNLMRSVPALLASTPPPDPARGCETLLPSEPLSPRDVAWLPSLIGGRNLVLVIDEFDRIASEQVRTTVADAIKQVSDRGAPVSFLIVGVADSPDELLGSNPSVYRSIVPVELPLLEPEAVWEILDSGFRASKLFASPAVLDQMLHLVRGAPYMAHLLGLRSSQAAIDDGRQELTFLDIDAAASQIVREVDPATRSLFAAVIEAGEAKALYNLVKRISGGERDIFGRFRAEPATQNAKRVAGVRVSEVEWSRLLAARLIRPVGKPSSRLFSFATAHLEHYVLLQAID